MNHETRKQKHLRRLIRCCEEEIKNVRTLPYYRIFNRQAEQEEDLRELQLKLQQLRQRLLVRTEFSAVEGHIASNDYI